MVDRRLRRLYALEGAVFSTFLPFFVLWLRDRGFSPSEIGVILSSSALAGVIAAPGVEHRRRSASRHGPDAAARVRVRGRAGDRAGAHRLGLPGRCGRRRGARRGAGATVSPDRRARDAHARTRASARVRLVPAVGELRVGRRLDRVRRAVPGGRARPDAAGLRGRRGRRGRVRRAVPARAPAGAWPGDVAVRRGGRSALDGAGLRGVPARRVRVRCVDACLVGLRPAADPGGRRGSVPGRGRRGRERVRRDPVHALERLADPAVRDAGGVRRRRRRVRRGLARVGGRDLGGEA